MVHHISISACKLHPDREFVQVYGDPVMAKRPARMIP